jgi:hypothetical protein
MGRLRSLLIPGVDRHRSSDIGTIIRRESHWQSRVLRNDLH